MKPGPHKTSEKTPESAAALPPARKPRADGIQSRRAILLAAANLATTRGLHGLSIGELAQHIGMSKSGLYAHFKSKEELELAAVETAAEIFDAEVIRHVDDSLRGCARVLALADAFLQHLKRRVFPGGCFFAAVAMQVASHPGRVRDRVMQTLQHWSQQIGGALRQASESGELSQSTDLDQVEFEVSALLLRANFSWILTEDARVLEQARIGVGHVLERVATPAAGRGMKSPRRRSARSQPRTQR